MTRWYKFLIAAVLSAALAGGPVFAATPFERVVSALQEQGFEINEVSRTWLGRIKIEASNEKYYREIVMDRSTGEVLRDYWIAWSERGGSVFDNDSDDTDGRSSVNDNSDDDYDDDRDDDDDDDKSGNGSGNSGRGSKSSGSGSGGDRDDNDDDDDDDNDDD